MIRQKNWREPLKWNARCARLGIRERVFCTSLADVFDSEVPNAWRADLFALIEGTPNLDWLLLTKRPAVARRYLTDAELTREPGDVWPLPNVWLGVTVENQKSAEALIPILLETPAVVRFLSCEPLLGPVDLTAIRFTDREGHLEDWDALDAHGASADGTTDAVIDWVIAGGESGPGARPTHPAWFRSLRDQCIAAGVPFHFKQWGDWVSVSERGGAGPIHEFEDYSCVRRIGKQAAGRTLDGRTWDELPQLQETDHD